MEKIIKKDLSPNEKIKMDRITELLKELGSYTEGLFVVGYHEKEDRIISLFPGSNPENMMKFLKAAKALRKSDQNVKEFLDMFTSTYISLMPCEEFHSMMVNIDTGHQIMVHKDKSALEMIKPTAEA